MIRPEASEPGGEGLRDSRPKTVSLVKTVSTRVVAHLPAVPAPTTVWLVKTVSTRVVAHLPAVPALKIRK